MMGMFLYTLLRPLPLPSRLTRQLHPRGSFHVSVDPKCSFKLRGHGYSTENRIFWNGLFAYEPEMMKAWITHARRAQVVFDIGANIGLYSLTAAAVNPSTTVYGFEAIRHLYAEFAENCALSNLPIHAIHAAASDYNGTAAIHFQPGGIATASLNKNDLRTQSEPVATIRLDTFIEQAGLTNLDLIKVDVEGCEPAVLSGLGKCLLKFRPVIFIEILSDQVGVEIEAMTPNYIYYCLDRRGSIHQDSLMVKDHARTARNFLLLPN
jgi:FkbM family methyltransferase